MEFQRIYLKKTKTTVYYDNFSERTVYDENRNLTSEKLSYDGLVETQIKQNKYNPGISQGIMLSVVEW